MTKKILFIDDESSIINITELFFKQQKCDYIIASSGEEAIKELGNEKENIGLVFLDLMMPGISGFEVLEFMRENSINIPTIIQSGLTDDATIKRTVDDLGAVDFITKPYTKQTLFKYVNEFINPIS
jgi:DNA-binding response OmpR family regulator